MSSQPAPFDIYPWLPEEVRHAFEKAATLRRYGSGELIYAEGDEDRRCFRLLKGNVRLSVTKADGRQLLYLMFEPGDCFGTSSPVDGEPRPQTAEAGSDVEVLVLSCHALNTLRAAHREIDDALLRLLARHMRVLSSYFADSALNDLPSRVASRIVRAARSFGVSGHSGIRLSIGLSQAEIALMVGSSRQSVSKVLQQFQKDGLITIEYGNLSIHAIDELMNIAAPE